MAAAATLIVTVHYLRRTPKPLVDLSVLRIPTYRVTALGGSVFRAVAELLLPAPRRPNDRRWGFNGD
uniref:hypothetical protein n=1 Tax=Paractinoplanes polyasparticus TaxID=2856853 RepID=UPI001C84C266|nr:hypothetical protein [Actinoplanes polyasparticus]